MVYRTSCSNERVEELVRACCRIGKPELAVPVLGAKQKYGLFPSLQCCELLMAALIREERFEDVPRVLEQIIAARGALAPSDLATALSQTIIAMVGEDSLESNRKVGVSLLFRTSIVKTRLRCTNFYPFDFLYSSNRPITIP